MIVLLLIVMFEVVINQIRNNLIMISDTHIGGPWFGPGGKADDTLLPFLKQFTLKNTTTHTFVINGDWLDLWLFNFSTRPPKPHEMLLSSDFGGVNIKILTDTLNLMMDNGVDVIYINGNHDDFLTYNEFKRAGLERIQFHQKTVVINNVNITHGHVYDYFNCPDPENEMRAFGYYMMRAATESGNVNIDEVGKLYEWTCNHVLYYAPVFITNATWLYQRLIGGSLGETVWGELANKEYKKVENETIKGGCYFFHNDSSYEEDVIMSQAVQKYRCQIGRFLSHMAKTDVENMISGACDYFDYWIKKVNQDLFLMSHTHIADLRVLKRSTSKKGEVVYVNSGAWLKLGEMLSYVNVTMGKGSDATETAIYSYDPKTLEGKIWKSSKVPATKKHRHFGSMDGYDDDSNNKFGMMKKYMFKKGGGEKYEMINKKKGRGKNVPACWKCDPDFYDSRDGCDCGCGCWDPDCGPVQTSCFQTCANCG